MTDIKLAQQARLASIDWHLLTYGKVNRQEHADRFGLEGGQATRDLGWYQTIAPPGHVRYSKSLKCHVTSPTFKPLFKHMPETGLARVVLLGDDEEIQALHRLLNSRFGTPPYPLVEN